jgi:hypothetical protein
MSDQAGDWEDSDEIPAAESSRIRAMILQFSLPVRLPGSETLEELSRILVARIELE